jgi:phosphatidylglycerophosphatase C
MSLVFFDFDGTLTRRDTILPLGIALARARPRTSLAMARFVWLLICLKGRLLSNHQFKQAFCGLFLKGRSQTEIDDLSRAFTERYLEGILKKQIVDALKDHLRKGDEVYLVSSNFAFLLRPLQHTWNASGLIATEPEVKAGLYTGKINGRSCHGSEKVSRVLDLFGPERVSEATAYGDSRSDRPLLAAVKRAVWV